MYMQVLKGAHLMPVGTQASAVTRVSDSGVEYKSMHLTSDE